MRFWLTYHQEKIDRCEHILLVGSVGYDLR